jgi:putative zinc finger/helix-turn-helix YgiT family protein
MRQKRSRLDLPVNGERISVPGASHLRCPACGEIVLRLDEARHLREGAHEIYRTRHGLLTADEIRSLRERLGLTQMNLAKLLRLGNNTISRWESGRNVQTAAMDVLLRMVRDVPGTLEYLRTNVA